MKTAENTALAEEILEARGSFLCSMGMLMWRWFFESRLEIDATHEPDAENPIS